MIKFMAKDSKRFIFRNCPCRPLIGDCWLSGAITLERLNGWLHKRTPMKLDSPGFMRVLESLQLDNGGKRNQLSKLEVKRCHLLLSSMLAVLSLFNFL